jgi:hypothetical protein
MVSNRANPVVYGVILIVAVAFPIFLVTFPEMADRVMAPVPIVVALVGLFFVGAGLFRRNLSYLLLGSGFLIETAGDYYSNHWVIRLGLALNFFGIMWMIKRQAARSRLA